MLYASRPGPYRPTHGLTLALQAGYRPMRAPGTRGRSASLGAGMRPVAQPVPPPAAKAAFELALEKAAPHCRQADRQALLAPASPHLPPGLRAERGGAVNRNRLRLRRARSGVALALRLPYGATLEAGPPPKIEGAAGARHPVNAPAGGRGYPRSPSKGGRGNGRPFRTDTATVRALLRAA
jgi:hypothetical protein